MRVQLLLHSWLIQNSVPTLTAIGAGLSQRYSAGLRAGKFPLRHRAQIESGAHPATYPMGTTGSFPGDKAAGL
jgi:hypothetical protein